LTQNETAAAAAVTADIFCQQPPLGQLQQQQQQAQEQEQKHERIAKLTITL
jgi:hypothetical protein